MKLSESRVLWLVLGLVGLIGLAATEGSCEEQADRAPDPQPTVVHRPAPTYAPSGPYTYRSLTPTVAAPKKPTPTLGVSLSKIESLFENTGYRPFDRFSDTERAAMYFDGSGSAVMVSLYGYPHDLESIGISFGGLNETMVVTLTVELLMEELEPDWTDRVLAWVDDNYPSGGRKKIEMIAGTVGDHAECRRPTEWQLDSRTVTGKALRLGQER